MKILHFCNNDEKNDDRLFKIRLAVDDLKTSFQNNFTPYQNLCIDESLLLFKGRLKFKQYIPSRRCRFGVKLFLICDCQTGYVLNFIIYAGSTTEIVDNNPELGKSGQIVLTLMETYLNKGHSLYIDNWYTSPLLFVHKQKTNACGTIKKNRKFMPDFPSQKIKKGDVIFNMSGPLLVIKWCDKREILMLTTMHEVGMAETGKEDRDTGEKLLKPISVSEYNNMGAVDTSDMVLSNSQKCKMV